jgi:hypothetical protein
MLKFHQKAIDMYRISVRKYRMMIHEFGFYHLNVLETAVKV